MTLAISLIPLIFALAIAVAMSAIYSGAETAALSVNEPKLRERAERGHRSAVRALRLMRNQQRVLAIVLVGTNIANVVAALIAERIFGLIGREFGLPQAWFTVLNFLCITPVLLILGEIVPKHFCRVRADNVLPRMVGLLRASGVVMVPILNFCAFFTGIILRPLGIKMGETAYRRRLSVDDLKEMVGRGGKEGSIERSEHMMIARIFDMPDTIVREVMRPLVDVVALELPETTLDTVRAKAAETGYSRFPVFDERIIRLKGYIDIYDVLRRAKEGDDIAKFVRAPFFVPETMSTSDLLEQFLRNRLPAAIVLDEHGGSVGWVTREDVLEEVVGEIEDEFDRPGPGQKIKVVDESTLLAPATVDLDDINRQFDLDLPEDDDFDTLGGLVFTRLGRVPQIDDVIIEDGLEITVIEMDQARITRLRLRVLEDDELEQSEEMEENGEESPKPRNRPHFK